MNVEIETLVNNLRLVYDKVIPVGCIGFLVGSDNEYLNFDNKYLNFIDINGEQIRQTEFICGAALSEKLLILDDIDGSKLVECDKQLTVRHKYFGYFKSQLSNGMVVLREYSCGPKMCIINLEGKQLTDYNYFRVNECGEDQEGISLDVSTYFNKAYNILFSGIPNFVDGWSNFRIKASADGLKIDKELLFNYNELIDVVGYRKDKHTTYRLKVFGKEIGDEFDNITVTKYYLAKNMVLVYKNKTVGLMDIKGNMVINTGYFRDIKILGANSYGVEDINGEKQLYINGQRTCPEIKINSFITTVIPIVAFVTDSGVMYAGSKGISNNICAVCDVFATYYDNKLSDVYRVVINNTSYYIKSICELATLKQYKNLENNEWLRVESFN